MSLFYEQHSRPRMPSPSPSFARMTSTAINIPSSRGSPASTPSLFNGSLQSTPEGMVPFAPSSLPAVPTYTLPESLLPPPVLSPPTSSPSAMAEALGKGPGLIRRVSRGAQGIPNRFRRGNTTAHRDRDKSSGPVIMRRRSDSRTAIDADTCVSDLEAYEEEDAIDDYYGEPPLNGLGINMSSSTTSMSENRALAPILPSRLEQGTPMKKIAKKEQKAITLRLDLESARVYWDTSRQKSFYIDDVKEIRYGPDAKHYREECDMSENWAPYWFTIVYTDTTRSKNKIKTMHLVAPDAGVFNMWTKTLDSVSRNRSEMMIGLQGFQDKSAKLVWQRAMKKRGNDEESLDFPSTVELCRSLHINCTEATLRAYFSEAAPNGSDKLNQTQFLSFVTRLRERKDIKRIFDSLTFGAEEMDKATFFRFLQQEQGIDVDADVEGWTSIFDKVARRTKPRATPTEGGATPLPLTMNFPAFQTFLTSSNNSVLKPKPSTGKLQLNRPLNEYFISSSHNTYLLGRQVAGESSTEAYISALQKGCRCIEIDCWDGGDGLPVVMHGRTLTKAISFHDTIKVVNKFAFAESPYPLILSLEVHCSPMQQQSMARIMIGEFKDALVLQPLDFESHTLPTPEELKHRILIKVKGASEDLDTKALANELTTRRQRSFSSPWSRPVLLNDNVIPNSPLLSSPPSMSPPERAASFWASPRTSSTSTNITNPPTNPPSAIVSSAEDSDSPNATVMEESKKPKKTKTSNITKELGTLGVYTRGVKFTDFGCTDANTFNHVFSLNERKFETLTKAGSREKYLLEEHNVRCLMRVYPHAFRITSTNFDPLKCWRRGVQMVALNWQTYDLGQQLNQAMFAGGDDRTGYVLKPTTLRRGSQTTIHGPRKAPKKEVKFTVQIMSAQQLPRPRGLAQEANINPYVEFEMYCAEDMGANAIGVGGQDASAPNGHSGIGNPLRKRTEIVPGNGYNPEFQGTKDIEMKVTTRFPSLVFVRWTVWHSLDAKTTNYAPLASFTAKLNSLQQGYRHLPLFDSNGEQYLFSTLFCKIKKQEIVDAPEVPISRTGSLNSPLEPSSPSLEPTTTKPRNFVRRLISRGPSERRKRLEERTGSESRESDLDYISRSSTFER
ncbi:phosphoinositide phospholipase [Parastagonospora nodorum]|uniref:Phosphoinositide phospholipase C n=1 Tax=Phaeosphaeria nodorum (strain SN15 / ATCC MYA-4574 / FGSC 10173) TaxID=321614 RepID=A0A7U2FGE0_PHANO|nr:phosphoinositide phospholipase [Parastagonospora nodorum]QRD04782.1 phosphoinositide phospholipase [Parastagonospora nodorum SN15]KAH3929197.1 phosphoinositide phospholipase [Parastagonospora nodorum]KAH3951323.1 phosphoinositide phospholipase [Parastagonospora nodorum]KAH3975516.1 phosphoinositide phospholipase [Parastagonospora nodorum]